MRITGRIKTIIGALASLLLIIGIFNYQSGSATGERVSIPTTNDAGPQGLEGLYRWLDASGVNTLSLRQRFDALPPRPERSQAGKGHLLIISWPTRTPARASELEQLKAWIAQGNNVLLLLASLDQPIWAKMGSQENRSEFLAAFGLDYSFASDEIIEEINDAEENAQALSDTLDEIKALERIDVRLKPASSSPVFGNVDSVVTRRYENSSHNLQLVAQNEDSRLWPVLQTDDGVDVLYRLGQPRRNPGEAPGSVWVSRYSEIVSNAVLAQADNRKLLAGIVNRTVGSEGVVVFDDFHFGLSDLYDPDAFYEDPRLHRTLGLLGVLWLLWLAGRSTRLAPIQQRNTPVSVKSLVEATGGLYARMLTPQAAGQAMLEHFMRDMKKKFRTTTNADLWNALAGRVGNDDKHLKELQEAARTIDAGAKPSLKKLSQTIYAVRQQIDSR